MNKINKTYSIYPDMMEPEDYFKILITEYIIYLNNGHWNKDWPKDHITVHVGCNDTFYYACADSEDILYSELEGLYNMHLKDPDYGVTAWCIKKRKQLPLVEIQKWIKDAGIWNLDELVKGF